MSVAGVGGVGGAGGLSALAAAYRAQVVGGADTTAASTATTGAGAGSAAAKAQATRGADFTGALGDGLAGLEALDGAASQKAVQAATGDLREVHDYVIAATQAQVATELTTTVRNKALEAFNDIMRMPL